MTAIVQTTKLQAEGPLEKGANSLNNEANGAGVRPPIIRLEGLTKIYTEGEVRRTVLDELNREFYEGEFVCLLGKSGSGKSTLLNLISGIDAPTRGDVVVYTDARPVRLTALSEQERTLFRRRHIGIVFQFFNLIPTLTVLENVTLPLELNGWAQRQAQARARALLERVGLGDRLETFPDKLSGGEQQRVAIARALAHDPLLILADEPTGNLDEDTGETVLSLLLELTRDAGKTLFMATHAPEVARRADRVLHLDHGKLVSDQVWRRLHEGEA
ncbi:MAG: ABC transporter ATP-binding protein [Caldilinea sp.]|uniref:ABC transporter ATP-binding protein n=1 Tax=Caldilinea sp. TaxID=2293560 RepID=UPI0021DCB2DB|nr:ABC transporter ATP-binding protein [Caldilinea sp.]GIV70085.1 MAG: putative ABC transporter ATP-binding protein [Caldilinea sp.]